MRNNSTNRASNIILFTKRNCRPHAQPNNQNHDQVNKSTHKKPYGKYAKLHQAFLQTHHPNFYNRLVALDKLDEWLHTIDEIATHRFELGKSVGYSQAEIENTLFKEVIHNLR
ncbi:MAG: TnpV protein [Defluviitaleaceae bacterium]|nr:TnpV protein [Defluviitaleaceae bacterium]